MPEHPTGELPELITQLSDPNAYQHPVEKVEVRQTHISLVFLAGACVYKVKKPVNLGFLDFSTLERRKHFCEEELRLNRRLAPHVYLGVLPITREQGGLRIGGAGHVVEWAVHMQRLPNDAMLESRLQQDDVPPRILRDLAGRLAQFHRQAESSARISAMGRLKAVAQNARENFLQTEKHIGITASSNVYERVRSLTEGHLQQHGSMIESRADRGVPRDTHGDLHLDHVYLFPEAEPPNDLVIIDCIEFSDRFRYADPVADMAFLVMDLAFHGRRDLARPFAEAYFQTAGDADGLALLPFYSAYRAVVRAKVEGMKFAETEIDARERGQAQARAQAHWLLALGELETPGDRPALIILAGLPGAGKSSLARALAKQAHFHVFRSDEIRRELAGLADAPANAWALGEGIYAASWTERTYKEMCTRAEQCWRNGERVLIDANFREEWQRDLFLRAANRWGVPALFFHCRTRADVARARLQARRGDVSDADWTIRQKLADSWQPFQTATARFTRDLETSGTLEETVHNALAILRQEELA